MRPTVFQKAELRDENDNIVQQGTYGKGSALSNSTNDAWIDYVMNNLEALYGIAKDEVVPVSALPASGDMNKTYLLTTTGVCYRWDGTAWVEISSSEAVGRAEAAADLAEEWATKTDGAVADNEYSAKYYANAAQQSADDAQDVADDMADHLAQIDENTTDIGIADKRISNIEKLLQGNLYDYQTDSTSAYTKSVPAGAMPYAGLEKVGGKTVVMNQLAELIDDSGVSQGITWTKNNNGTYSAVGTSTGSTYKDVTPTLTNLTGHKILIRGCPANDGTNKYMIYDGYSNGATSGDYGYGKIYTAGANVQIRCFVASGATVDIVFTPQVFDLTLMFGSGNEPSTVEEFESMFPASYYAYSKGTLLSAGVTEVVSKDSNNATLQTYPIPTAIRNLEGYGWSAGTAYNYVDFERKVFVKRVGRKIYDGTETWWAEYNYNFYAGTGRGIGHKIGSEKMVCSYCVCDTSISGTSTDTSKFPACFISESGNLNMLRADITHTGADMKAWCLAQYNAGTPLTVYYELVHPVEIDISEYLTDDNLINVEAGGTLTFPNSNGTDYQIPVPSEETYMIDLQEAISNG